MTTRLEKDEIGEIEIDGDDLSGIHTKRALHNFTISGKPTNPDLVAAYATVKLAAFRTAADIGFLNGKTEKINAIESACLELSQGDLSTQIAIDSLQGGAGTSTNMAVNEVIANRALQILGKECGNYKAVHPIEDINIYQSTNDTYPTALKLAAIRKISILEQAIVALQESFQEKEKEFAHIVKIGRTQLQDSVLITLGREMGAYADVLSRDRWRIYKCEERLRVVNLGGTAIGTGITAPRDYIFRVVDKLREITGIGFARAENLVDPTQNQDVFVEVSGMLKAYASSLIKICNDLRLLSSNSGYAEINLPIMQAGSSVMPGKVNPVIPEAVIQGAITVISNDMAITTAVSSGNLELNAFMPLIAENLLASIDILINCSETLSHNCIKLITANEKRCRANIESSSALVTALIPVIGYDKAWEIAKKHKQSGLSVKEIVLSEKTITEEEFEQLISPEAVSRLGWKN